MTSDVRNVQSHAGPACAGFTSPVWSWTRLTRAVAARRVELVQSSPVGSVLEDGDAVRVRRLADLGRVVCARSLPLEDAVRQWEHLEDARPTASATMGWCGR